MGTAADLRKPLLERVAFESSPLEVDEEAGVIKGVKVLGRLSKNSHGISGASEGTEYTDAAHADACRLYEGMLVRLNHPDRKRPRAERSVSETFGQLRECETRPDGTFANLHYYRTHPMAATVVEDVKRGMGGFGLSHNAYPSRTAVRNRRYVIEGLASVHSVDLVDRPATNKNLWESEAVSTTFKAVLEGWVKDKKPGYQKVAKRLLEDDMPPMAADAPVDAPAEGADPDEALWQGFLAAIQATLDKYATEKDPVAAGKAVVKYLKAHAKLMSGSEPSDSDTGDGEPDEPEPPKAESQEVKDLRGRVACLEAGVEPTPILLKTLGLLESDADRKALVASTKATPGTRPKSGAPTAKPPAKPGPVTESRIPTGDGFVKSVRG
jgi:hypothetical protein